MPGQALFPPPGDPCCTRGTQLAVTGTGVVHDCFTFAIETTDEIAGAVAAVSSGDPELDATADDSDLEAHVFGSIRLNDRQMPAAHIHLLRTTAASRAQTRSASAVDANAVFTNSELGRGAPSRDQMHKDTFLARAQTISLALPEPLLQDIVQELPSSRTRRVDPLLGRRRRQRRPDGVAGLELRRRESSRKLFGVEPRGCQVQRIRDRGQGRRGHVGEGTSRLFDHQCGPLLRERELILEACDYRLDLLGKADVFARNKIGHGDLCLGDLTKKPPGVPKTNGKAEACLV